MLLLFTFFVSLVSPTTHTKTKSLTVTKNFHRASTTLPVFGVIDVTWPLSSVPITLQQVVITIESVFLEFFPPLVSLRNPKLLYLKMVVRKFLIQGLFLFMLFFFGSSVRYDCCQPQLSSTGLGCTPSGTYFSNQTYYCVSVAEICPSCKISAFENITSSSCYQCCATGPESCGISVSFISTSSWSKYISSISSTMFFNHWRTMTPSLIHKILTYCHFLFPSF